MSKFRKKPVVIEAQQLSRESGPQLGVWCGGQWHSLYGRGDRGEDISHIAIDTLEGRMRADLGDWIIRGVKGEFYPCKPDIFAATYEAVSGDGKAQRPEGSAEAPLGRSEHIPTPEGRGGEDIVDLLTERRKFRYAGDCKCGKCCLVPHEMLCSAIDEIKRLRLLSSPRVEEVRREALEEAAKWIGSVGRDWKADGQHEKRFAADYLAAGIRSLSPPVG